MGLVVLVDSGVPCGIGGNEDYSNSCGGRIRSGGAWSSRRLLDVPNPLVTLVICYYDDVICLARGSHPRSLPVLLLIEVAEMTVV